MFIHILCNPYNNNYVHLLLELLNYIHFKDSIVSAIFVKFESYIFLTWWFRLAHKQ